MRTHFGCIADDFTGATDLAGFLARSGMDVTLRIGLPEADEPASAAIEVVALKSRMSPVPEAVGQSRAALDWLRGAGATRFYFKYCSTFDSTPQGNIGPVAEALRGALGAAQVVHAPALPVNGRRVFMGHLFVHREPLHESPMKDHPLTPMRDSNLLRLLAPQIGGLPGLIDLPTIMMGPEAILRALDEAPAQVILDGVCDADLETLARALSHLPLWGGGSAFGASVARALHAGGMPLAAQAGAAALPKVGGGQITLSGSGSAMTRAQVQAYAARVPSFRLDPLALASGGSRAAQDWLRAQDPSQPKLVYATAEPAQVAQVQARLGADAAGRLVEDTLAALAVTALEQGVRRFVVAGGETSGAVTRALGVRRLRIGPEIAPGVPWTFGDVAGAPVALALKSGNFGEEDFFADAHELLAGKAA